jgi:ATP-dependent helicase YprA (DUF1998 family)
VRSHSRKNRQLALSCDCRSVCPSSRVEQRCSHWTDFREKLIFGAYMKICPETPNLVQNGQKYRTLYMNT